MAAVGRDVQDLDAVADTTNHIKSSSALKQRKMNGPQAAATTEQGMRLVFTMLQVV